MTFVDGLSYYFPWCHILIIQINNYFYQMKLVQLVKKIHFIEKNRKIFAVKLQRYRNFSNISNYVIVEKEVNLFQK